MEHVSTLSAHWLEIAAAVYLLAMVLYGHYKGFIRRAVSAVAMIITLVAVNVAMPYVTDWLKNDTPVYEAMKDKMAESIGIDIVMEEMGLSGKIPKEDEWTIIEKLPVPEQMKRLLTENNNTEVYKQIGVQYFRDYVAGYLADMVLKAAVFLIMFLGGYILLHVLATWLDLIAKLPILSGMNQIAGAILGGVQALIFIWIVCLLLTALSGTGIGKAALAQIEVSKWLSWIYDHNLLTHLFIGLIRSVG